MSTTATTTLGDPVVTSQAALAADAACRITEVELRPDMRVIGRSDQVAANVGLGVFDLRILGEARSDYTRRREVERARERHDMRAKRHLPLVRERYAGGGGRGGESLDPCRRRRLRHEHGRIPQLDDETRSRLGGGERARRAQYQRERRLDAKSLRHAHERLPENRKGMGFWRRRATGRGPGAGIDGFRRWTVT